MDIQDTEQLRRASVHAHKGYDTPAQALNAQARKRPRRAGLTAHDGQTQRNGDLDALARSFLKVCSRIARSTG